MLVAVDGVNAFWSTTNIKVEDDRTKRVSFGYLVVSNSYVKLVVFGMWTERNINSVVRKCEIFYTGERYEIPVFPLERSHNKTFQSRCLDKK